MVISFAELAFWSRRLAIEASLDFFYPLVALSARWRTKKVGSNFFGSGFVLASLLIGTVIGAGSFGFFFQAVPDSPVRKSQELIVSQPRIEAEVRPLPRLSHEEPIPQAAQKPRPTKARPPTSPSGDAQGSDFGMLTIAASPWAEVWIDGKLYGETPLEVKLSEGRHAVTLKYKGTKKLSAEVVIRKEENQALFYNW